MDLSLVIPVYNSDELLDKLVNNIIDLFDDVRI